MRVALFVTCLNDTLFPRAGQATVELALGLLVFVTVLLFGIHFAEVGWLSLKVQEAGAWAMWEAAGANMRWPGPSPPRR